MFQSIKAIIIFIKTVQIESCIKQNDYTENLTIITTDMEEIISYINRTTISNRLIGTTSIPILESLNIAILKTFAPISSLGDDKEPLFTVGRLEYFI